jgi:dTDP-glucose 4,6-dehydratase
VRPFNNYGPRQHLEKVIPRFITSVILGEKLRVHGNGMAARDFTYVEDNCEAIDLIMHAPAEEVVGGGIQRGLWPASHHFVDCPGYHPADGTLEGRLYTHR